MAAEKTRLSYAIVLADDPKDFISVARYDVGRVLSIHGDLAEVSFPRQRGYIHSSQLICLNGEERTLANTFKRIDKAREDFTNSLKCEPPVCYLKRCSRLLNGIKVDLKHTCVEALPEIDSCYEIVSEWLTEIEKNGQVRYLNGAQHFDKHINNLMKILAQNIVKRTKMRL